MHTAARLAIEPIPRHTPHRNPLLGGQRHYLTQAIVAAAIAHTYRADALRSEHFENGINPVDDHGCGVAGRRNS
jgi:hypothetical protein